MAAVVAYAEAVVNMYPTQIQIKFLTQIFKAYRKSFAALMSSLSSHSYQSSTKSDLNAAHH